MIQLVPAWAHHYDEFWQTIRRRNLWLIKLRYGAVVMLLGFILASEFLLGLEFTGTQITAIAAINISILLYNSFLHWIRQFLKCDPNKFNPLHFSLVQMLLDFTALGLLVHFTGGIESPLYLLFIFHIIIGSLILPGWVIYSLTALLLAAFSSIVFFEYFGVIPHHSVEGILKVPFYNDYEYIAAYLTVFIFVVVMSVIFANRIAKQLYRMEQDLIESLAKLNAAEKEKQKYIMGIVHEIKSPLSAVHSYLDVILQNYVGPLSKELEARLKRVKIRAAEGIGMINNVLRISNLRLLDEINKEEVNLHELLASVLVKQKAAAVQKKVLFKLRDERNVKRNIWGDKFLLEVAFSNLISNAVKYVNHEGLVEITLFGSETETEIHICDNGIGIPQSELSNIFKDFYRASNIKLTQQEGIGLGLSIVKQIVIRHGGKVDAISPSKLAAEGRPGACFRVMLPVKHE